MDARKAGYFMLGIGVLAALFSGMADYLGLGKPGIQSAQILGIQAGIVIAILGLGVARHLSQPVGFDVFIQNIKERFWSLPALTLIVVGFILAYIFLFIFYMFLNPEHHVQYFNRYLPEINPIGHDLVFANASIKGWLAGQSLYEGQNLYYPPFYAFIFAPLLLLSYPANYYFVTFLSLAGMASLFFLIPLLSRAFKPEPALMVFFFLTALFSYGMQFELERGQFNVTAFTLAVLAVYLYHYQHSLRYYAYLLFSISIQLKLYPAVLILMFIKDWRDWKNNLLRFLGLAAFNVLLLFVVGWQTFLDYIKAMPILLNSDWSRPYNHSIRSFVYELGTSGYGALSPTAVSWVNEHLNWVEYIFMAYYFACLLAILLQAYKNREQSVNFSLLLVCTIGAMVLPSSSVDYKLPLLAFPLAMVVTAGQVQLQGASRMLEMGLYVLLAFAYSVTLFPFIYKTGMLSNNLPMLFVILTASIILNYLRIPSYSTDTGKGKIVCLPK